MHTPGWECYLNQSLEDRTMASTFLSQNFSVCSLRNRGMGLAYSFFVVVEVVLGTRRRTVQSVANTVSL